MTRDPSQDAEHSAEKTAAKLSDLLDEGKELDEMSHELVRTAALLFLAGGALLFLVMRYF